MMKDIVSQIIKVASTKGNKPDKSKLRVAKTKTVKKNE